MIRWIIKLFNWHVSSNPTDSVPIQREGIDVNEELREVVIDTIDMIETSIDVLQDARVELEEMLREGSNNNTWAV